MSGNPPSQMQMPPRSAQWTGVNGDSPGPAGTSAQHSQSQPSRYTIEELARLMRGMQAPVPAQQTSAARAPSQEPEGGMTMRWATHHFVVRFTFCPEKLASMKVSEARETLTMSFDDILYANGMRQTTSARSEALAAHAPFHLASTVGEVCVQQGSTSTFYLPMNVHVEVNRPTWENGVEGAPRQMLSKHVITQNRGPGDGMATLCIEPGTSNPFKLIVRKTPENHSAFLLTYCPGKTVEDVGRYTWRDGKILMTKDGEVELDRHDPVIVYTKLEVQRAASKEAQKHGEHHSAYEKGTPEYDDAINKLKLRYHRSLAKYMRPNDHEKYFMGQEEAAFIADTIRRNYYENMTVSDLLPNPRAQGRSGMSISIFPDVPTGGGAGSSGYNSGEERASFFTDDTSPFLKAFLGADDVGDDTGEVRATALRHAFRRTYLVTVPITMMFMAFAN